MNEQAKMMNQQQQQKQQLMNMNQNLMSMNQMNPHSQPQVIAFNQNKPFAQPPPISQSSDVINFRPQMVQMNRSYGMWAQPQQFQKSNPNAGAMKPPPSTFTKSLGPRNNWKGKKVNNPSDKRRMDHQKSLMAGSSTGGIGGVNISSGGGSAVGNLNFNSYNPPTLNELQRQNRLNTRKYFPKKKFNKNNNMKMNIGGNKSRSAPFAPRNTTSFIIRAKKSGGIAPLVSPYPATPAVLPTPIFSPSREVLVDMAKEEWGVDGYGSMKGLIRLRSPGHEIEAHEDEEEDEGSSGESDVEEHVEVERRLDHDLSRFEMIYNPNSGTEYQNVLENRVDDQDSHIAQLEEENLILKERLFLMERELRDLRKRMLFLERRRNRGDEIIEEVVENDSENETESREDEVHSVEDNNEDLNEENIQGDRCVKGSVGCLTKGFEAAATTVKIDELDVEGKVENKNIGPNAAAKNKEENNNVGDELIEANRPEENIDKERCADVEAMTNGNVDDESYKHVTVGDVCMLEDGIANDEKDVAN